MKKTTLYIIIAVIILLVAGGIIFYFYDKKKKKTTAAPPKTTKTTELENIETTVTKPYDNETKALVDAFFKESGLGVEQQAAMLDSAQENIKKYGKMDGVITTMSQWMPAWVDDTQHADIKDKITAAWSAAYKKWSELKAKHAL